MKWSGRPVSSQTLIAVGVFAAVLLSIALVAFRLSGLSIAGTPADAADEPPVEAPDTRPQAVQTLETDLAQAGQSLNSRLGIAVIDIGADVAVHYNGEQLMPQQSVSKMWVALTALDQVDSGTLDLAEQGTVRREDLTLFHQPIRKQVLSQGSVTTTYADFMSRALVSSDNTANDMLLKRVGGPDAVRAMLEDKELSDIRFGPGERIMQSELAGLEWDSSFSLGKTFFEVRKTVPHGKRERIFDAYVDDPVDGATTLALAKALAALARGELLSAVSTEQLLTFMRDAKSGANRLKGGVPEGWQIAHKTGTGQVLDIVPPGVIGDQTGYNDIGILTAPDGAQYAVAVMIGRTRTPVPERMDMMHAVVAAIVRYHESKGGGAG